jgi:hypothetical protein
VWTAAPEGCRTLGAWPYEKDQMGDSSSNVTVEIYGTRGHAAIGALSIKNFHRAMSQYRIHSPRSSTPRRYHFSLYDTPFEILRTKVQYE